MTFVSGTQLVYSVINVKAVVATFNQEKALVGLRIATCSRARRWAGVGCRAGTLIVITLHCRLSSLHNPLDKPSKWPTWNS